MTTPALAVDVGTVRVGLAGSDETGRAGHAAAHRAPPARGAAVARGARRWWTSGCRRASWSGLPRRLDGSEGNSAADARAVADQLHKRTGLPVEMWDERFTTVAAERSLIAAGQRRAQRRRSVDAVAAALLLQSWLDSRPTATPRR